MLTPGDIERCRRIEAIVTTTFGPRIDHTQLVVTVDGFDRKAYGVVVSNRGGLAWI